MMMVKHCTKNNNKQIYFQKKNKKIKTSIFFPSRCPPSSSIHVPFPEIEIKRQLRENFSTTDQDCILRFQTADNNKTQTSLYPPTSTASPAFLSPSGPSVPLPPSPSYPPPLSLCTSENLRYFIK